MGGHLREHDHDSADRSNRQVKQQLRESLQRDTLNSHAVKIAKHVNVYTCGDQEEMICFIESGRIKVLMLSPEGKECLLAIHSAGDIFGELCLSGSGSRLETATAMEETSLKQIPCSKFLARLSRDSLFDGFVRYLAGRIADQQQLIADMVTVDSEQRLGKTLLQLARTLGKKEPRGIRIELQISHVVGDGRNDTAPDHSVYTTISGPRLD
jgi:CRP-like cAMP-binding protein